ncbi:PQQ-dependent sugar dehydrogenase [Georgenia muralis]|uniref:PQQ-dependent sugar dehydrogenase n=1 Tax=Georgenia muralis TaxID=154117 RepID=UPI001FEBC5E6|nr:PQQ-dependent sugar dehydrogenase [Georgenia muralis]
MRDTSAGTSAARVRPSSPRRAVWLLVPALALGACAPSGPGTAGPATTSAATPGTGETTAEQGAGPSPEVPTATSDDAPDGPVVLASGLHVPWGLALLPDGSALVTLRDRGEVLRVREGAEPVSLGEVPGVFPGGEGGLLGVAVAPGDGDADPLVYLYLTTQRDNRVLRMRLEGDALVEDRVILEGIPRGQNHNGGRLAFGPDGYLYVTTGDAGQARHAQDPASLGGKILRVDGDGRVPPDNPDPGSPVWTLGHRNVQGLAWAPDGRLFASEFGQNTWDELNLIIRGENYGWPTVEGVGGQADFTDPLVQWPTADASPSGIAVADGAVWLAALRGESLWRVPLDGGGDAVGEPQRLLEGEYGRMRTVVADEDGRLWLLTSNTFRGEPAPDDDRLVRLDPADLP